MSTIQDSNSDYASTKMIIWCGKFPLIVKAQPLPHSENCASSHVTLKFISTSASFQLLHTCIKCMLDIPRAQLQA